jgi:hypothetical protein
MCIFEMQWVGFYIPSWPRCSFITDPNLLLHIEVYFCKDIHTAGQKLYLFCNIKHTPYGRTFQINDVNRSCNVIYVSSDVGVTTFLYGCSENLLGMSLICVLWKMDDIFCWYYGRRTNYLTTARTKLNRNPKLVEDILYAWWTHKNKSSLSVQHNRLFSPFIQT